MSKILYCWLFSPQLFRSNNINLIYQKVILLTLFHIFIELSFLAFVTWLVKGTRPNPRDLFFLKSCPRPDHPLVPLLSSTLLSLHPSLIFLSYLVSQRSFSSLPPELSVCSSSEPVTHPIRGGGEHGFQLHTDFFLRSVFSQRKQRVRPSHMRSVHVARTSWLLHTVRSPLLNPLLLHPSPFPWNPTCE